MKVKRRVCSAALTLAMTLSLLVTMVLPAGAVDYAGGSGTRNDPYLIATAQQLKNFRDQVNAGDRDLCASLIANVDLAGQDWDPIGLSSSGYVGTFEGNGYAIRNLKSAAFPPAPAPGAAPSGGAGCSASWARAAWSGGSMWTAPSPPRIPCPITLTSAPSPGAIWAPLRSASPP